MNERHDHAAEAIAAIDAELNRPPVSIEVALQEAVTRGTMTSAESQECLEAYLRAFHKDD